MLWMKPLIKTPLQIPFKHICSPDAELSSAPRINAVAYRDSDIETI